MVHLWVRAEQRPNERRVALTPGGTADLVAAGHRVTVEESRSRVIPVEAFAAAGAATAPGGSWPGAPADAWILGLKELPDDDTPLVHRHVMFGHAYKGQPGAGRLLRRFAAGGGTLYDLEYLTDAEGRRVAAFGYWAGYAGAAVSLTCWAAQQAGGAAGPVSTYASGEAMLDEVRDRLAATGGAHPDVLVIGALGRVGRGAATLCERAGLQVIRWDVAETAHGGPFPQALQHEVLLNCILAGPGAPVFVPADAGERPRRLRVIGDIACDPGAPYAPIRVYDRATDWQAPALRVHADPPLDVMAIDNLPSLLPREASEDFAAQLLPHLMGLPDAEVWQRAAATFAAHRDAA